MTPPPESLTENPKVTRFGMISPDLLSHVLSQIRLSGDHIYTEALEAGAALDLPPDAETLCCIVGGGLSLGGTVEVETGELLLMPRGIGHAVDRPGDGLVAVVPSKVVVCRFHFETESMRALVALLPGLVHIRRAEGAAWLDNITYFLLAEAGDTQPGGSLMISRLIDLMVIRTLRTWVHGQNAQGWLGGLADARIARTLQRIHEAPFEHWAVADLAAIAGMSRSSFYTRFVDLVGVPPLRYHGRWRLTLARDMLIAGARRVGEVALTIGYESEAAFSRAYKLEFGHPPAADLMRTSV
jgi:AraC-like DNA-binding protein